MGAPASDGFLATNFKQGGSTRLARLKESLLWIAKLPESLRPCFMVSPTHRALIVGGGAAGFFAAITCAEAIAALPPVERRGKVLIQEATLHPLAKVRVSGGGRCNLTHACPEPRELAKRYPRGSRELIGPFSKWGPRETIAWFEARGVTTKTEADGRMFPTTDDSATVVDCLRHSASNAGVVLTQGRSVLGAQALPEGGFEVRVAGGTTVLCDRLLIASGGNAESGGLALARAFGHTIETPVPSLFTFHIKDPRLGALQGLACQGARVTVPGTKLCEEGPVLVTHWGLSGPAILRCSAWGARELAEKDYQFTLRINWSPSHTRETAFAELGKARTSNPKKQLATWCPFPSVPARLWERLLPAAGIPPSTQWSVVSNDALKKLAAQVTEADFLVSGKATNKEEFVTCGGVRLKEIDFKTMESRLVPGLYFAGEVLDIDGITGGFNFQAAWTTGRLAGQALAEGL